MKMSAEYYMFLSNLYQEKYKNVENKNSECLNKIAELEAKLKHKATCI